jgi:hypothetical protein
MKFLFRERFNDLQTKLQELDVLHQSPNELFRTTTPSSRDSGVPVRSSSSCCSLTSESASTPKSSLELPVDHPPAQSPQTSVLHFFLHPPIQPNHRHVSVRLNEEATDMSYIHDTIPRYQSQGRNVHWNDEQTPLPPPPRRSSSQHIFQHETQPDYYNSDSNIMKKNGQRILLNASLPNNSKLNIRIHADRTPCDDINDNNNNINKVQAIATIESLDNSQYEQEHVDTLRRNYLEHYSTNDKLITMTRTDSPIQRESRRDKLPRHRQVSLPISLPIDQRLYLYIHNGEVLARC